MEGVLGSHCYDERKKGVSWHSSSSWGVDWLWGDDGAMTLW
jgi:hypothetical protein